MHSDPVCARQITPYEIAHHVVDLAHAGFGAFDATAENDGKWLQDDRFLQLTGKDPLSDVQQLLEHKSLVLLVGDCIPQVLESVGRVPRLVLKGASEQDLFGGIVGEPFPIPIDGLDEQAAQQVEQEALEAEEEVLEAAVLLEEEVRLLETLEEEALQVQEEEQEQLEEIEEQETQEVAAVNNDSLDNKANSF